MSGDSTQGKHVVQARVKVAAQIDQVWSAWTVPERLAEWFPDRVDGTLAVGERVGFASDAVGLDLALEVVEIAPQKRLRFRGATPETAAQKLDVIFKDAGGEATMVRLEHAGFGAGPEARDVRDRTASGWQTAMALLRVYVESYFGRARVLRTTLSDADVAFHSLHRYYTDAEFLRRWLTDEGSVGAIGEQCELVLHGDLRMSGEVLSRYPGRDVALACSDIGGVLVLCACPSPRAGRAGRVGAWVCTWEPDSATLARLEELLPAAVERLTMALLPEDDSSEQ